MELHPPALEARTRTPRVCLPRWGDLIAQRRHVLAGLDVEAFTTWALVYLAGGRAPSTVRQHVRQIRFMQRNGLDWSVFLSSPAAALDEAGAFLAPLALDGKKEAVRNYKKSLNWVAAFHAQRNPDFTKLHWPLPQAQRVEPRRVDDDQVQLLRRYWHHDVVLRRRRRALAWFILNTGLRRGEIGDIRLEDLNQARGVLLVGKPRKNGKRREIPLPDSAWDPEGDLQLWLGIRHDVAGGWLWTTDYHGAARRMNGDVLYNTDLTEMSLELGFRVSFTKVRHWRGRTLRKKHRQPLEVVQAAYGHADPKTTMGYVDDVDAGDMRDSYTRGGVPGFRSTTPAPRARAPGTRARGLEGSVIEDVAAWSSLLSGDVQEGQRLLGSAISPTGRFPGQAHARQSVGRRGVPRRAQLAPSGSHSGAVRQDRPGALLPGKETTVMSTETEADRPAAPFTRSTTADATLNPPKQSSGGVEGGEGGQGLYGPRGI